jgi:hypothetical protein
MTEDDHHTPLTTAVQKQASRFPAGVADDVVLTLSDFVKLAGVSMSTVRRMILRGDGPVITQLSERRRGVRVRHARAWLDVRASSTES